VYSLLLVAALAVAAPAQSRPDRLVRPSSFTGQRPLNLGFEQASVSNPDHPWGWTFGWSAFGGGPATAFTLDSLVHHQGRRSLRIERADSIPDGPAQPIILQLPAGFARGREIRLAGWARTADLRGTALITLEAWKNLQFAAADTARISRSEAAEWTRYETRIRVPADSTIHSIVITLALDGRGKVWFDELRLLVDGSELTELPGTADPPARRELAWLAGQATPLESVLPALDGSADPGDLRKIGDIAGPARIVGLGESTHGTREFFQVKHRLLEYLIRRHGFGLFAIEANQLAVERINRYVMGGSGTAREVIRVMFRVWNTEEMVDLVEWMRSYNVAHPARPVRFAGYDMQDHRTPADTLRAFLERSEPALLPRFDQLTGEYRQEARSATPHIADSVRARWGGQADTIWSLASARRMTWLTRSSTREDTLSVEWAVQAANLFRQAARFNVALSSPERDSLMAANLDWVLRVLAPGTGAVVWAHDVHVSQGGDSATSFNGGAQMGAYLSKVFDYDYRAFTLLTFDGSYTAARSFSDHRMIEVKAFPAPPGSIESALHQLERPARSVGWVVDLRPARAGQGGAWLRRPRPIRHVGYAAYDYGFELNAVLPQEFDGVVFIDHTTPSRLTQ
jgi:erythromycin esterase